MKKTIVTAFALLIGAAFSSAPLHGGQLIYGYGFENWNGTVENTPNYPFSSGYEEYCAIHVNSTEVVTSYQGVGEANWTPHSGNYFFLRNNSPNFPLNPPVSGIPIGHVSDNGNIGWNGTHCGNNDLEIYPDIATGEIFIRFWARLTGFDAVDNDGRCKWVYLCAYDSGGHMTDGVYWHLNTNQGESPGLRFYHPAEGYLPGDYGTTCINAGDGNWHKWSFYVNFNTGTIRAWYDVDNETAGNAIRSHTVADGQLGDSVRPGYFKIQANFSGPNFPQGYCYHGIDDLEIWDGMPEESGDTTPPDPPENVDATAVP